MAAAKDVVGGGRPEAPTEQAMPAQTRDHRVRTGGPAAQGIRHNLTGRLSAQGPTLRVKTLQPLWLGTLPFRAYADLVRAGTPQTK